MNVADTIEQAPLERIEHAAAAVAALENPAYMAVRLMGLSIHDRAGRAWAGYRSCHRVWMDFQLGNPRTLILAPRGHGKSTICTVLYAIWKLLNDPNRRILIISNTDTQAVNLLGEIKAQLESPAFREVFGNLRGEPWHNHQLTLSTRTRIAKEASITAMGVFGPVISGHYDDILVDDSVDEKNARSEKQRETLRIWYRKKLLPCLEPGGDIHVLGTRYHPLDLYNDIIEVGDLEREQGDDDPYEIMISEAVVDAERQEVLCAELYDFAELMKRKREMGSILFAMQYQNDVELAKGAIFRPEWIQYVNRVDLPAPTNCIIAQGYDLAISAKDSADYFASATVAMSRADSRLTFYVLDMYRARGLTFRGQLQHVKKNAANYAPERVGIESVAYQAALEQEAEYAGLPAQPVNTHKGKTARAYKLSALFENGQVKFLRGHPTQMDCIDELLVFPDGEHDDLFDALEIAISVLLDSPAPVLHDLNEEVRDPAETEARYKDISLETGEETGTPADTSKRLNFSTLEREKVFGNDDAWSES